MRTRYPTKLGTLGSYLQGKLDARDKGDLALAITADRQRKIVHIDFGTEITWLGMEAHHARMFAETLLKAAKALEDGD